MGRIAASIPFVTVSLAVAVALMTPALLFARDALATVTVDLEAQATAERARAATLVSRILERTLDATLTAMRKTGARPEVVVAAVGFVGRGGTAGRLREPESAELALADLVRQDGHRFAGLYDLSELSPVAHSAAAAGEAGAILLGTKTPEIRTAVGVFDGGGSAALEYLAQQVVRNPQSTDVIVSNALPSPPWELGRRGPFIVFVGTRAAPGGVPAFILVAPDLSDLRASVGPLSAPGRTLSLIARDAADPAAHVVLTSSDESLEGTSAPEVPGFARAFQGPLAGGGGAPGSPGQVRVVGPEGERIVAYAPVRNGEWAITVTDDPAITLAPQRRLAEQLVVASQVAVAIAGLLAVLLSVLLGRIERQRRIIEKKSVELAAASQAKSRFLASMSHELRTPLNSIIGFAGVLRERVAGDLNERQLDYVADIESSGQHLLALINEVLDLSKVEAGKMDLVPGDLAVADLVRTDHATMTTIADRAGITLHAELDDAPALVHHDGGRLRQVHLNLLGNALKFTPRGGTVTTSVRPTADGFELSVRDTGVGISEADLRLIFEEFRQVGTDRARAQQGTGLGLALVKRLVQLMGGTIAVTSSMGKGSTFTVVFPLRQPDAAHPLAAPEAALR